MQYKSVRGMEDMLPGEAWIWREIEACARREFESSGYLEIRTPILEDTSIFVRGIGETTDIVSKEMFTFPDRKGRSLSMRPEGTAPIVRAYIEHALLSSSPINRLYYIGPMFRAERPQKGRLRQFFQVGAEVIGSNSPYADIEVIAQIDNLMKLFRIAGYIIKLNTLGCRDDKAAFAKNLYNYLSDKRDNLCDDCRSRMDKNVLRALDCKNDSCKDIVKDSPSVLESLCGACKTHYEKVKSNLNSLGIKFEEAKNLVRGLDYYTGTVFEITHPSLGAQDAIGAGGRYDNLVKDMGGADAGAVGYALGIERMIIALKSEGLKPKAGAVIYIATVGDAAKLEGVKIARNIRSEIALDYPAAQSPGLKSGMDAGGICSRRMEATGLQAGERHMVVLTDIGETSLKSQLRNADKNNALLVMILGDDELKQGKATIKDMSGKMPQMTVEMRDIVEEVRKRLC